MNNVKLNGFQPMNDDVNTRLATMISKTGITSFSVDRRPGRWFRRPRFFEVMQRDYGVKDKRFYLASNDGKQWERFQYATIEDLELVVDNISAILTLTVSEKSRIDSVLNKMRASEVETMWQEDER